MEENKFNFSEEEAQSDKEKTVDQTKAAMKQDAIGLLANIKRFFKELLVIYL